MRNNYLLLLSLLCFSVHSQNIIFSDPDFKSALIPFCDTDSNGEISIAEAAATTEIIIAGAAIDNLDGLQYFSNIGTFYLSGASAASLDLTGFGQLMYLHVANNTVLTSLVVSGASQMNEIEVISNPSLASVSVAGVLYATDFTISGNTALTSLNVDSLVSVNGTFTVSGNTALSALTLQNLAVSDAAITGNGLTTLVFDGFLVRYTGNFSDNQIAYFSLTGLATDYSTSLLDFSGNTYTAINLAPLGNEYLPFSQLSLRFDHTQLHTLEFTQQLYLSTLTITNNSALEFLSFRNGTDETCAAGYCLVDSFDIHDNPALQTVCTDAYEVGGVNESAWVTGIDWVHQTIDADVAVIENCEFSPAGSYDTVTGTVRFGSDATCSAASSLVPHIGISSNGYQSSMFTGADGAYTSFTTNLQMTVSPMVNSAYFNVSPTSQTVNFSGIGQSQQANFCLSPNGTHNDLTIDVLPIDAAVSGFDTTYRIVYRNQGTTTQSGTVNVGYWTDQEFVSASVTPASQSTGNLVWNFSNLAPFESRSIDVILNVNSPTDTPPISSGNVVSISAWVTGASDETAWDNTDSASKTVQNSFDPNDKQVSQGAVILVGEAASSGLTYTIRFQNTGTANAQRVVITDMLDTDLDANSVVPVASSHPFELRRMGNSLEFWFDNIDLPYESGNEPESHGFVSFSVKGSQSGDLGTSYQNTANIYFDFNAPIVTNTTQTDVYQLSTPGFTSANFSLYPNPARNLVHVASKGETPVSVEIMSLSGQLLLTSEKQAQLSIDVSPLATGTYLVRISSDEAAETRKLVKY